MASERTPAKVFDPREFCRDEMAEDGLTERDLPFDVRRWLTGTHPMPVGVARQLHYMFGTSPDFWLNLDGLWQVHCKRQEATDGE